MSWIETLSPHWAWLILAAALATAEVLVPGFFLIWFALAAFATGLIALLLPIPIAIQLVSFAVFAVVSVYAGRRWFKLNPIESADPKLNDRGARMVGEVVTVVEAIEAGSGRVKIGDSVWSAKGPDTVVGAKVRIIAMDGGAVLVEPI
ncbi:MAG: NfeD family protein [Pseudomonadota bacterium]